jgi:hypothetical protein
MSSLQESLDTAHEPRALAFDYPVDYPIDPALAADGLFSRVLNPAVSQLP